MVKLSLGEELLRMAVEIEKNGCAFYTSAADLAKETEVRDKFGYLAAREQQHKATFEDMLTRVSGYTLAETHPEEWYSYIKDLADESIITEEKAEAALASKPLNEIQALNIGIGFEKDSILFYSERGMFPSDARLLLDAIKNEEKKHLSELSYVKKQLLKS